MRFRHFLNEMATSGNPFSLPPNRVLGRKKKPAPKKKPPDPKKLKTYLKQMTRAKRMGVGVPHEIRNKGHRAVKAHVDQYMLSNADKVKARNLKNRKHAARLRVDARNRRIKDMADIQQANRERQARWDAESAEYKRKNRRNNIIMGGLLGLDALLWGLS